MSSGFWNYDYVPDFGRYMYMYHEVIIKEEETVNGEVRQMVWQKISCADSVTGDLYELAWIPFGISLGTI